MAELKPCPFCGDAWLYYSDMDLFKWKISCLCGYAWATTTWEDTRSKAIEAWNRRAGDGNAD